MGEYGLVGDLIAVLSGQIGVYTELLALSHKKREIIVRNDVEGLKGITAAENGLVGKSQRLERERVKILRDVADVMGERDTNKATLDYVAGLVEGKPEAQTLKDTVVKLRGVLTEIKDVNEFNRSLIQNSLDYIDFSINVMRSAAAGDSPYVSYGATGDGER